jgi:SAM-dependent methyltransferase
MINIDNVTCIHVYIYFHPTPIMIKKNHSTKVFKEVGRVLRPGGKFIISQV